MSRRAIRPMAAKKRVRPIAIAAIVSGGRLLVSEGHDKVKHETFYRSLGGKIEFGERGADAVVRELREELAIEIINPRYLGALENIFTFGKRPGHEIVMIFACELAEPALYQRDLIEGVVEDGKKFRAVWKPIEEFHSGRAILYPHGILDLLEHALAADSLR